MKRVGEIFSAWLHRHPLFLVVAPLMAGIVCGEILPPYWGMSAGIWWIVIVVAVLIGIFAQCRRHKPGVRSRFPDLFIFFIALFSLGILLMGHQIESVQVAWAEREIPLALRVMESPAERGGMWRLKGRIQDGSYAGRDLIVQLGRDGHAVPRPGDIIHASAYVRTPHTVTNPGAFDYARYLRRQGISGQAYVAARHWTNAPPGAKEAVPLALRFARYRQELVDRYARHLDERQHSIVAAMTLGDKRGLDREIREAFSATGTSHVLALSGLHLGVLFAMYSWLVLRGIRRRPLRLVACLVGIGLLWGYVLLAGAPLSLVRSAIMFTLWQLADCLYREHSSLNHLALAALLILLFTPASLFDVGFQLSFLSVFFILLLSPHFPAPAAVKKSRVLRVVYGWAVISLVAQSGTMPLVAYYFHTVTLVGCLANILVIPLVYVILAAALLFLLFPFGSHATVWLLSGSVSILDRVTSVLSALPFSHLEVYPHWSEVVVCYALFALVYAYLLTRDARCLWGMGIACLLWSGIGEWKRSVRHAVPSLVVYENYAVPMIHVMASADRSWLWTTDSVRASHSAYHLQQNYWAPCGIRPPRMVQADSASRHRLRFHSVNMVWVTGRLPWTMPGHPEPVSHLLLVRGCTSPLSHLLAYYRPRHILLDGSLSDYWRGRYSREADSLHLSVYDIRRQGAWIEPLAE